MNKLTIAMLVVALIIAAALVYVSGKYLDGTFNGLQSFGLKEPDFHIHADLKVFLDGKELDMNADKYMEGGIEPEGKYIHFHTNDGQIVHMHKEGMKLSGLFSSIGMKFTKDCFVTDTKQEYCNSGSKTLKFYVNGEPNNGYENYVFRDLDRILISYGDETPEQLKIQADSISSKSCIESGKCPEKGEPTDSGGCSVKYGCSDGHD